MLITSSWKTDTEPGGPGLGVSLAGSRGRGWGGDAGAGSLWGALREVMGPSSEHEGRQQPSWGVPWCPPWHGQRRTLRVCPAAPENSK